MTKVLGSLWLAVSEINDHVKALGLLWLAVGEINDYIKALGSVKLNKMSNFVRKPR